MHTQKLRDLAFLQLELRQQQAKEGLVCQRLKRNLGNSATTSTAKAATVNYGSIDDVAIVEEVGDELEVGMDPEGDRDETSLPSEEPGAGEGSSGKSFASLMQTYDMDDEDDDDGNGDKSSPDVQQTSGQPNRPKTVRLYFGQHRSIPIKSLFNWSIEEGWDQFWFDGMKNLRQEMEFYDLAVAAESAMTEEAGDKVNAGQLSSGGNEVQPIIID